VNTDILEGSASRTLPYSLDKAGILADLTTEKPQWILSAYGPGRNAPIELFDGPREQSFEEMRLLHYIAVASGNPQQAVRHVFSSLSSRIDFIRFKKQNSYTKQLWLRCNKLLVMWIGP
jgi:nucleoporin NUP42